MRLFEAAKWAPSSYNAQPWRFPYATRDGKHWRTFFDLLAEGNQTWAANAAALIVVVSKKTMDNSAPSITYCFDAGAAWQNLALQADPGGMVVHGMQGFDYAKPREALHIPDDFAVMAMLAVGSRQQGQPTHQEVHVKVLIISADQFEDTELLVPLYRLQEEDISVDVASLKRGAIKGKHGYEVTAGLAVDEVDPAGYSALLLPGG